MNRHVTITIMCVILGMVMGILFIFMWPATRPQPNQLQTTIETWVVTNVENEHTVHIIIQETGRMVVLSPENGYMYEVGDVIYVTTY